MKRAERTYRKVLDKWHTLTPQERGEIIEEAASTLSAKEKKELVANHPEIGCIIKKIPKRRMPRVTPRRRKLSR